MKWRVEWSEAATDSLTICYLSSRHRSQISLDIEWIEAQLSRNPDQSTIALHEGLRTIETNIMRFYIVISPAERVVMIHAVSLR